MATSNEQRLIDSGCGLPISEFLSLLMDAHHQVCPAWTIDELVCHPRDAIRFCDHVRSQQGCEDLLDDVILKIHMNNRKRG